MDVTKMSANAVARLQQLRFQESAATQLKLKLKWMHKHNTAPVIVVASGKGKSKSQSKRKSTKTMLTKLTTAANCYDDTVSVRLLLRKSLLLPRVSCLSLLNQLILHRHWYLAINMYKMIKQSAWHKWDPKLHAQIIALLVKYEQSEEVETLLVEADENLKIGERVKYLCILMDSYSKYELKDSVVSTYQLIKECPLKGVDFIAYRSLLRAWANMNLPTEAEKVLIKMKAAGHKPTSSEYKIILHSYGKCGLFEEMERLVLLLLGSGYAFGTVTLNMIIGCYSSVQDHKSIKKWLRRASIQNIRVSVRTVNAIAKACPTLNLFAFSQQQMPLSTRALMNAMNMCDAKGEVSVIREILNLALLPESVDWSPQYWKLDLHGMLPSTAYVTLLVWLDEVKKRIAVSTKLPTEVCIVCGMGKHSTEKGKSPVKMVVSQMLQRMTSPFRIDRYNKGRIVSRAKPVQTWLNKHEASASSSS